MLIYYFSDLVVDHAASELLSVGPYDLGVVASPRVRSEQYYEVSNK